MTPLGFPTEALGTSAILDSSFSIEDVVNPLAGFVIAALQLAGVNLPGDNWLFNLIAGPPSPPQISPHAHPHNLNNGSSQNSKCSQPYKAPPGHSGDVVKNAQALKAHHFSLEWFKGQVDYKGAWDYRYYFGAQYDAYGNFNYGATCEAIPFISDSMCLKEAALSAPRQTLTGGGSLPIRLPFTRLGYIPGTGASPYTLRPEKFEAVKAGIEWAKKCLHL